MLGACVSTSPPPAQTIDRNDYTYHTPYDPEMTVFEHQKEVSDKQIADEEYTYNKSIESINNKFEEEMAKIGECQTAHPNDKKGRLSKQCMEVRKGLCAIDILIDSRGTYHKKSYCGEGT
jgi:hypothetical protein